MPLPPLGSVDTNGSFTPQFMRQEAPSVMGELMGALPEAARAKVSGVPLKIVEDPKDVNAFAGCTSSGAPFVAVTAPLLLIMARTSETRAFDETFGTAKYDELANGFANEVKAQKTVAGPPPGFLPLPQTLDPRKLSRQKLLFDEQLSFVIGHELAHHHRGHTGCANGSASSNVVTPQDVGRLLSSAVPLFNQPNEVEADVQGTFNLLDTGSHRQGGAWTEEGAVMALDFFTASKSRRGDHRSRISPYASGAPVPSSDRAGRCAAMAQQRRQGSELSVPDPVLKIGRELTEDAVRTEATALR